MTDCHHTRQHLVGYINHALPKSRRKQVASHLQSCDVCYATYVYERDVAQRATTALLLNDTPSESQFGKMWGTIQSGMSQTASSSPVAMDWGWQNAIVLVLILLIAVAPAFFGSDLTVARLSAAETPAIGDDSPTSTQDVSTVILYLAKTEEPFTMVLRATPTTPPMMGYTPEQPTGEK